MNQHQINQITEKVKNELRADGGKGVNRRSGVYWVWYTHEGKEDIWVSDTTITKHTISDLANYIVYQIKRGWENEQNR